MHKRRLRILASVLCSVFFACGADDGPTGNITVDSGADSQQTDAAPQNDGALNSDRVTCTITIRSDTEADGTIDTIQVEHVTADGRVLSEEYDASADGTIDQDIRRTYDSNGNVLLEEVDGGADGSVEQWTRYAYNAEGKLTRRETGKGENVESRITYTYDTNGSLTAERTDNNADGEVDNVRTHVNTHDDGGRLIRVEVDLETDGTADLRWEHSYNGDGQLKESRTTDLTGEFAGLVTFTQYFYNADSSLQYTHQDSDGDGTIDMERRYSYDEQGAVVSFEWKRINTEVAESTILLRTVEYEGTCSPDYEPELR